MEIEQQIRAYLGNNLIYVDDTFQYDNDTSFIREGLIDSMQVMELVMYVQSAFGVTVNQEDIIPENFDSINNLVSFIRSRRAVCSQAAD